MKKIQRFEPLKNTPCYCGGKFCVICPECQLNALLICYTLYILNTYQFPGDRQIESIQIFIDAFLEDFFEE